MNFVTKRKSPAGGGLRPRTSSRRREDGHHPRPGPVGAGRSGRHHRRQCLDAGAVRAQLRRIGRARGAAARHPARAADHRGHRGGVRRRHARRARHHRGAPGHRREGGDRRLRRGLFVAALAGSLSGRHPQDRQELRGHHHRARPGAEGAAQHRGPGPRPGADGAGRGRGDRGPAHTLEQLGVQRIQGYLLGRPMPLSSGGALPLA